MASQKASQEECLSSVITDHISERMRGPDQLTSKRDPTTWDPMGFGIRLGCHSKMLEGMSPFGHHSSEMRRFVPQLRLEFPWEIPSKCKRKHDSFLSGKSELIFHSEVDFSSPSTSSSILPRSAQA